jgi:hypothetical protein
MKVPERVEVAKQTDQDKEHARKQAPDSVAEEAPIDEQQPPTWACSFVVAGRNFETFLGGEGI